MNANLWIRTVILAASSGMALGLFLPPTEAVGQFAVGKAHPQPTSSSVDVTPETAWTQATGLDNLISALGGGMYFETNYPDYDFAHYLEKVTQARAAAGQGNRPVVQVDMAVFFGMLAGRDYGISEAAAEELANFARIVMPNEDDGAVVPKPGLRFNGGP